MRKLSPIELTALGIVWKRGPCTAYALMREFAQSTSSYYSGRTGTIYPVVGRLVAQGLIGKSPGEKGDGRTLEITGLGIEALQEWLTNPIPPVDIAHTADLVRLRTFYLGTLPPDRREQFIEGALEGLREYLGICEASAERDAERGDPFSALASKGVIFETEARIRWLESVRDALLTLPH